MNWSDMAPQQRLLKSKRPYKWEQSPGLEHHCGVCATPLHNARAKATCIGKHVEPCYRFHQQLHFVGKSQECKGCAHAHEMHYLRHKNILQTMRKLAAIDEEIAQFLRGKITMSLAAARESSLSLATLPDHNTELNETPLRRRDSKAGRRIGSAETPSKRRDVEAFSKSDTDFVSNAIHQEVEEGKGAWKSKHTVDTCSSREECSDDLDVKYDSDDEETYEAPDTPLNAKRQRREKKMMGFVKACHIHGTTNRLFRKKTVQTDPYDGLDPEIFDRLGIKIANPHTNTSARKELMRKLIVQLKDDIEIQNKEKEEARTREEAFWIFAGKGAYNVIMENRENIDWATGVRRSSPDEKSSNREPTQPAKDSSGVDDVNKAAAEKLVEYITGIAIPGDESDETPLGAKDSPRAQEKEQDSKPKTKSRWSDNRKRAKSIGVLRIVNTSG